MHGLVLQPNLQECFFGLIESIRDSVQDGWEDEYYHDPAAENEEADVPPEKDCEDADEDEAYDSMYEDAEGELEGAENPDEKDWHDGEWDGQAWEKEEPSGKAWEGEEPSGKAWEEEAPSTPKPSKTPKSSRKGSSSGKKRSGKGKLKRFRSVASLLSSAPSTPPEALPRTDTQESYEDPEAAAKEAELRGLLKQIGALSAKDDPKQPACTSESNL